MLVNIGVTVYQNLRSVAKALTIINQVMTIGTVSSVTLICVPFVPQSISFFSSLSLTLYQYQLNRTKQQ